MGVIKLNHFSYSCHIKANVYIFEFGAVVLNEEKRTHTHIECLLCQLRYACKTNYQLFIWQFYDCNR